MPIKTLYIALLWLLSCSVYVSAQTLIYSSDIPVVKQRIILEQTRGGLASEMLSNIEYIPLEGGPESVLSYIQKIKIIGDKVGIISGNSGYFYLFDIQGNFIKKIDKIKGFKPANSNNLFFHLEQREQEFLLYSGNFRVTIDKSGAIVDTLTISSETIKPDENGQFLQMEKKIGEQASFKFYGASHRPKRSKHDVLLYNDSVVMSYDVRDSVQVDFLNEGITEVYGGKAYLTVGYNTKIFELDSSGIAQVYDFILPLRNTLNVSGIEAFKKGDQEASMAYFKANPEKVLAFEDLLIYRDYLIIMSYRWSNPQWLAYNRKTKQIIGMSNIVSDKSNDYMPLFDSSNMFVSGDYLYSYLYPSEIRAASMKSADEGHAFPKKYQKLVNSNNPMLVRFQLR